MRLGNSPMGYLALGIGALHSTTGLPGTMWGAVGSPQSLEMSASGRKRTLADGQQAND